MYVIYSRQLSAKDFITSVDRPPLVGFFEGSSLSISFLTSNGLAGWKTNVSQLVILFLILVILEWIFNTASFDGVHPSTVSGSLGHKVSVMLIKY